MCKSTIEKAKLVKLLERLDGLIARLDRLEEIAVHRAVNQSYYMEKREELRFRLAQLEEAESNTRLLCKVTMENYRDVFKQWSRDIRWLASNGKNQRTRPVL